jgi:hypothetical protein
MKQIWSILCCWLLALGASAQPGIDEMQQAQQQLASSFFSALDFSMVLAGILGIIGGLRIYHNWQMGQPGIDEAVLAWFLSAVFMVLAGAFLQAVFGI